MGNQIKHQSTFRLPKTRLKIVDLLVEHEHDNLLTSMLLSRDQIHVSFPSVPRNVHGVIDLDLWVRSPDLR